MIHLHEFHACRGLSGGERSYCTLAFNLALDKVTDSPFRASDEFDVFMDEVNRRVSLSTLYTFAKEHPQTQFLFLTPLSIKALEAQIDQDFLRVQQMQAARR